MTGAAWECHYLRNPKPYRRRAWRDPAPKVGEPARTQHTRSGEAWAELRCRRSGSYLPNVSTPCHFPRGLSPVRKLRGHGSAERRGRGHPGLGAASERHGVHVLRTESMVGTSDDTAGVSVSCKFCHSLSELCNSRPKGKAELAVGGPDSASPLFTRGLPPDAKQ